MHFQRSKKKIPSAKLEIIGSGPFEDYYRNRAKNLRKYVKFYGFIEDQEKIQKIVSRWSIGLAPYKPEESNESFWGDPSKIKVYLSSGVPVITTYVSYMADEIKINSAGKVIEYNNCEDFIRSVDKIQKNITLYRKNAYELAKKYDYKKIYPKLFK